MCWHTPGASHSSTDATPFYCDDLDIYKPVVDDGLTVQQWQPVPPSWQSIQQPVVRFVTQVLQHHAAVVSGQRKGLAERRSAAHQSKKRNAAAGLESGAAARTNSVDSAQDSDEAGVEGAAKKKEKKKRPDTDWVAEWETYRDGRSEKVPRILADSELWLVTDNRSLMVDSFYIASQGAVDSCIAAQVAQGECIQVMDSDRSPAEKASSLSTVLVQHGLGAL